MTKIDGNNLVRQEAIRAEAQQGAAAAEARAKATQKPPATPQDLLLGAKRGAAISAQPEAASAPGASPFAFVSGVWPEPSLTSLAPAVGPEVDLAPDAAVLTALGALEAAAAGIEAEGATQVQDATSRARSGMMLTLDDAAELYSHDGGLGRGLVTQLAQALDSVDLAKSQQAVHTTLVNGRAQLPLGADVNALVQAVLRESYLLQSEVLRDYAEKVKAFNEQKKRIRAELQRARQTLANASTLPDDAELVPEYLPLAEGLALEPIDDGAGTPGGGAGHARAGADGESDGAAAPVFREWREGDRIETKADLEAYVKSLEERLETVGDDAQLANLDLQNALQQQQQTMQMMSNVSKMIHETAMSIIRKLGG